MNTILTECVECELKKALSDTRDEWRYAAFVILLCALCFCVGVMVGARI